MQTEQITAGIDTANILRDKTKNMQTEQITTGIDTANILRDKTKNMQTGRADCCGL
jgi:hypothetical protein